jgi:phenylalanyl-tRNA synthetase beta chain
MRVPREWLEAYVDLGDVSTETLAERLETVGLPVETVEQSGDDAVLDVEVTANRPDCLSIIGIAREAALLFGRALRLPEGLQATPTPARARARGTPRARGGGTAAKSSGGAAGASQRISVAVEDPQGCPRFTATVLDRAQIGPSPAWMQRRLEAAGVRAINTVVDVTNYVMLEMGQPMHAFDLARVGGGRLIVRHARANETLVTLDGVTRTLDAQALVVADAAHAVSLAGIIGGQDTEIGAGTSAVLLEAAYWDPPGIGRTSRRLGVRTEASARFERGADPEGPVLAQRRAGLLLAEVAGAHPAPGLVDVYPRPRERRTIRLRPARANAVLGVEVPREDMIRILRALGCDVETGAAPLTVHPPTYRPDLSREEDLIEEVARIFGYDRVPLTLPRGIASPGTVSEPVAGERYVRSALVRAGLTEVMTLTLVAAGSADEPPSPAPRSTPADARIPDDQRPAPPRDGTDGAHPPLAEGAERRTTAHAPDRDPVNGVDGGLQVRLANPLTVEHAALRRSLVPGLVRVLATNASRRQHDVHIFELGRVWRAAPDGGRPEERRAIGIAAMGRWRFGWNVPADGVLADFSYLRAGVDALLEDLNIAGAEVSAARRDTERQDGSGPAWWHPGRAADLVLRDRVVGRLGELHPDVAERERLPYRAYVAELDADALLEAAHRNREYRGLPRYPEVERDLAFVLPETYNAAAIERLIRTTAGPLLEAVDLFDVYAGPPVPPGQRNLAYRLRFRAPDRTLTAPEAEEIIAEIRTALQAAGAQLRA